jgi:hypothetical protein
VFAGHRKVLTISVIRKSAAGVGAIDPSEEFVDRGSNKRFIRRMTSIDCSERIERKHQPRLWRGGYIWMLLKQMREQRRSRTRKAEKETDSRRGRWSAAHSRIVLAG